MFKFKVIFANAQEAKVLETLKLLRVALTRWLSHGNASVRIIERLEPLVDSLDQFFSDKNNPELQGVRQQLLDPDNLLFLLLPLMFCNQLIGIRCTFKLVISFLVPLTLS